MRSSCSNLYYSTDLFCCMTAQQDVKINHEIRFIATSMSTALKRGSESRGVEFRIKFRRGSKSGILVSVCVSGHPLKSEITGENLDRRFTSRIFSFHTKLLPSSLVVFFFIHTALRLDWWFMQLSRNNRNKTIRWYFDGKSLIKSWKLPGTQTGPTGRTNLFSIKASVVNNRMSE